MINLPPLSPHVQCEFISFHKAAVCNTTVHGMTLFTLHSRNGYNSGVHTWFMSHMTVSIWNSQEAHKYGEVDAIPKIEQVVEDLPTLKRRIFIPYALATHE